MRRILPVLFLMCCCFALLSAKTERERKVEIRRAIDALDQGMKLYREGEYLLAIGKLNESQQIMDSPMVCYYLGLCNAGLEQYREAADYYQLALDQSPDFSEAQKELRETKIKIHEFERVRALEEGRQAFAEGKFAQAIQHLEQSLQLGASAEANYLIGAAWSRSGEQAKAGKYLQQALALEPEHEQAKAEMARIEVELEKIRLAEAQRLEAEKRLQEQKLKEDQERAAALQQATAAEGAAGNIAAGGERANVLDASLTRRGNAREAESAPENAVAEMPQGEQASAEAASGDSGAGAQARQVAVVAPVKRGGKPLPTEAGLDMIPQKISKEQDVDYSPPSPAPPPHLTQAELDNVLFPQKESSLWKALEPFLKSNPNEVMINSSEWHHHQALAFDERKLYDRAASELLEALKLEPRHFECNLLLGGVLAKMGRSERAAEQYLKTISLFPDRAEAYYEYGNFQLKYLESNPAAIESFRKSLELDPLQTGAYNNLAIAYVRQELPAKALETLTQGIAKQPGYAKFYRNRATIYEKYFQDNAKAIADYKKYLELGGEDVEIVQRYIRELEGLTGG